MDNSRIRCPFCSHIIEGVGVKETRLVCPVCNEQIDIVNTGDAEKSESFIDELFIDPASWLLSVPVIIVLLKVIPSLEWPFHIDRIMLAFITLIAIRVIRMALKYVAG